MNIRAINKSVAKTLIAFLAVIVPTLLRAQTVITVTGGVAVLGAQAESYGASPSASAATNTPAIQSALNVRGTVTLTTCGTYNINAPLILPQGGNVTFRRTPCVKLFLANGSNSNMGQPISFRTATGTTAPYDVYLVLIEEKGM